jgi:hypothetical protein
MRSRAPHATSDLVRAVFIRMKTATVRPAKSLTGAPSFELHPVTLTARRRDATRKLRGTNGVTQIR